MKVLITDKINEFAGNIIKGVAQVDFLPTMGEDELCEKIKDYDETKKYMEYLERISFYTKNSKYKNKFKW